MQQILRFVAIASTILLVVLHPPVSALPTTPSVVEHPNVLVTIDPEMKSQNEVTIAHFSDPATRPSSHC